MDMQGSRELAVTQQQAWDALNDPEVLKACIPGADKVEATGENRYAVGVAVKIGPVSARFAGKIAMTDVNPPHSYTLNFDGQGGAAGFGKGRADVKLTPREGTGCELGYTVNAQVGGKIAQMGQRLIDGVARSMAEDFFKRFDAEMQRRHPAPAAVEAPAAAESAGLAPPNDGVGAGSVVTPAGASTRGLPVWAWLVVAAIAIGAGLWLAR